MSQPNQSLSTFFYEKNTVDLDNCSREPVHQIGAIQAVGAMVVFAPAQLQVLSLSSNVKALLQLGSPLKVGCKLSDCLPTMAKEIADLYQENPAQHHFLLSEMVTTPHAAYQAVYHLHDGVGYLEFLPAGNLSILQLREKLRVLRTASSSMREESNFEQALQLTVESAREISGFARIKIYQFQDDWSGKVVAESKAAHMESFKGLAFPASDIPEQVRYLMTLVPYRCISSVDDDFAKLEPMLHVETDQALDLSWSILRSPSVMHTQYLRNMGVKASFGVSLMHRGRLWGIIACHHDAPAILPFDIWGLMHDLGATLMERLSQQVEQNIRIKVQKLRAIEEHVANIVRNDGDLVKAIVETMPKLTGLLDSDGFAFQYGDELYVDGVTPSLPFIEELLEWAAQHHDFTERGFVTDALADAWPKAKGFKSTACGVLIVPIFSDQNCYLIWFRGAESTTTQWAGNPTKVETRVEADGSNTLLPRHSFETWAEQHNNHSKKWTDIEKVAADGSLKNLLDIALYQIKLADNNKRMQVFSYAAAHDIKAPLRHIHFMLDMMSKNEVLVQHDELKKLTHTALQATDRLRDLVDSLMQYLVLSGRDVEMGRIQPREVVNHILQVMEQDIKAVDAIVNVGELPEITGNRELIFTMLLNLITNAIRYRNPIHQLVIDINSSVVGEDIVFSIADNGIGIPEDKAEYIFEPFNRLQSFKAIAGSGLGLSIGLLIAEIHGGTIQVDDTYTVGARMLVTLKQ